MTKTEELENRCIQGLIEAGKLTVLDADNVMASSVEAQVTLGTVLFPSPSADFDQATHALIPNPRRRWWTFWRPRTVVVTLQEPITIRKSTRTA